MTDCSWATQPDGHVPGYDALGAPSRQSHGCGDGPPFPVVLRYAPALLPECRFGADLDAAAAFATFESMARFCVHSDCDSPDEIIRALKGLFDEPDVRLLPSWRHIEAQDLGSEVSEAPGPINVEAYRRKGRFALDLEIWGAEFGAGWTLALFARGLASALGRSLLFSDCSSFGHTFFLADADGAIWEVLLFIGEDDDLMDLDPTEPYPILRIGVDDVLQLRPAGDPESWTQGDSHCHQRVLGRPCRVFAMDCPKRRRL